MENVCVLEIQHLVRFANITITNNGVHDESIYSYLATYSYRIYIKFISVLLNQPYNKNNLSHRLWPCDILSLHDISLKHFCCFE